MSKRRIKPIDKSEVRSVYSGRPGCCCGCNGNHRYASAHRAEASKSRGYTVADDEVSDRSVSILVNKINQRIAEGGEVTEAFGFGRTFFSFETETRLVVAYLY